MLKYISLWLEIHWYGLFRDDTNPIISNQGDYKMTEKHLQ